MAGSPISHRKPSPSRPYRVTISLSTRAWTMRPCISARLAKSPIKFLAPKPLLARLLHMAPSLWQDGKRFLTGKAPRQSCPQTRSVDPPGWRDPRHD